MPVWLEVLQWGVLLLTGANAVWMLANPAVEHPVQSDHTPATCPCDRIDDGFGNWVCPNGCAGAEQ